MKWNFWKKEKKQLRELIIPEEKIQIILSLWDSYHSKRDGQDHETRWLLWKAIENIFPETRKGTWRIFSPTVMEIKIIEMDDHSDKV